MTWCWDGSTRGAIAFNLVHQSKTRVEWRHGPQIQVNLRVIPWNPKKNMLWEHRGVVIRKACPYGPHSGGVRSVEGSYCQDNA